MDRVARGGKADFLRTSCESSLTARGGCGCPDACTRSRSGRQRSRWCIRRRWFRAPPYSLHGLNAVYLPEIGWHRIDARGNKSESRSSSARRSKSWPSLSRIPKKGMPEILAKPHPAVVATLERYADVADVHFNLPDIALISAGVLTKV